MITFTQPLKGFTSDGYIIEIAPKSVNGMPYEEAVLYCRFCTHNGYTDWRMPTRDEYSTNLGLTGWYVNRHIDKFDYNTNWKVCPVRDV
jgi:hypothetical protein